MTATNINISLGGELEAKAQSVLADLGLDVPTAINMFLTQVVERKALPFEDVREQTEPVKKRPKLGGWEGKIWMSDDFNEPMELVESRLVESLNLRNLTDAAHTQ